MPDFTRRHCLRTLLAAAPLLAGCGKVEEPLIPELKGRWDLVSNFVAGLVAAAMA